MHIQIINNHGDGDGVVLGRQAKVSLHVGHLEREQIRQIARLLQETYRARLDFENHARKESVTTQYRRIVTALVNGGCRNTVYVTMNSISPIISLSSNSSTFRSCSVDG